MTTPSQDELFDFSIDTANLYREESITDLKSASIRRLVPILPDGSDDASRSQIFIGHTQLMSPEGPLPIQARLNAESLDEAYAAFPAAMRQALEEVIRQVEQLRRQQQQSQAREQSRIIVPGR